MVKKPFGIVAIAVYAAFSGIILLLSAVLMLIEGQTSGNHGIIYTLYGTLATLFGVVLFAITNGLSALQEWARKAMIWYSVITIPIGVAFIFPVIPNRQIMVGNTLLQLLGIAVSLYIMRYLTRAHIKAIFQSSAK